MVKILIKLVLSVIVLWFSCGYGQPTDLYVFNSDTQRQTFTELTQQLRCLVCQNESLADSTAPLAQDLRGEIYQQIQQGKTSDQVKAYLLTRYGQFILFKPKMTPATAILWCAPFIFLLAAISIVVLMLRRQRYLSS